MKMKKILFTSLSFGLMLLSIILVASLSVSSANAYIESGRIGLLTVAESQNETIGRGGVADLFLTIKPGTGRIFIDSFPLSKMDTQITMRFASEVACDFLELDCSQYDFFYTIRANTAIVGGPSAGAAATVLTISMLDNQELDSKTIMTGTINSGGLIGPVSGISSKVLAAQANSYKKVLIPKWDNSTLDGLVLINVIPVSSLEDVLFEFTGKNYNKSYLNISRSESYDNTMKEITIDICTKYGGIKDGIIVMPNLTDISAGYEDNISEQNNAFFNLAKDAIDREDYYSAASFCFGGNVVVTTKLLTLYDSNSKKTEYAKLLASLSEFEEDFRAKASSIDSISKLETYMVVIERISDSRQILYRQNPENISARQLAYAMERLNTAKAWSKFFNIESETFLMDSESLKIACSKKIGEAEERINYMQLYIVQPRDRDDLSLAYNYFYDKDYPMCIFMASKAKADSDTVLSALFINNENVVDLLDAKLEAARQAIVEQESKNIFPILGYSYYEYAKTLKDSDNYSSLVYAEYALELSNLDMYFPKEYKRSSLHKYTPQHSFLWAMILGFFLGISFIIVLIYTYAVIISLKKKKIGEKDDSKKSRKKGKRKK
jgi:uncharacterized protein